MKRRFMWKPTRLLLLSIGLFAGLAPALAQDSARPPSQVKSRHGDWQVRCETPATGPGAGKEQCAIVQSVVDEERPNVTLVVIILKASGGKDRILRVIAPLGVLLPNGLGLQIDGKDIGRAGFVRCLSPGCVAEVNMDDQLFAQLREGKSATFIIFNTPEEGIGVPINLAGLGEGYDALP
jgi:invasion protein IalB